MKLSRSKERIVHYGRLARVNDGEKNYVAPPEATETLYICPSCGDSGIQVRGWVPANDDCRSIEYMPGYEDDTWCECCGEHTGWAAIECTPEEASRWKSVDAEEVERNFTGGARLEDLLNLPEFPVQASQSYLDAVVHTAKKDQNFRSHLEVRVKHLLEKCIPEGHAVTRSALVELMFLVETLSFRSVSEEIYQLIVANKHNAEYTDDAALWSSILRAGAVVQDRQDEARMRWFMLWKELCLREQDPKLGTYLVVVCDGLARCNWEEAVRYASTLKSVLNKDDVRLNLIDFLLK